MGRLKIEKRSEEQISFLYIVLIWIEIDYKFEKEIMKRK